jgi:hypothetical protein
VNEINQRVFVGLANAIEYEEVKFWEIGDNGRRKQRKQVAQKK